MRRSAIGADGADGLPMIGRDGSEGSGNGIEPQAVSTTADNAANPPMPMRRAMIASAIALSRRTPGSGRRPARVPVGRLLERMRDLQHACLFKIVANDLQANRETVCAEAGRHAHARQAGQAGR